MYKDQESIKVFERVHARDRIRELARRGESSSNDLDPFGAYTRAERSEGKVSTFLSIAAVAALIGLAVFLLK